MIIAYIVAPTKTSHSLLHIYSFTEKKIKLKDSFSSATNFADFASIYSQP
jgi:hypothetical protein